MRKKGISVKDIFIHNTAIVDEGSSIGEGTRIWHWCHIMSGASIGKNCNIGENAFIETGVTLGNNVKVKNNVALYTGVTCEDDVFLGPNCVFTNVSNPRSFIERKHEFKKTVIHKGASIGANATIICGHEIGEYSFVGAGSVVTKTVNPYTMVVGNPAKLYANVCKCGVKLDKNLECPQCRTEYYYDERGILHPRESK